MAGAGTGLRWTVSIGNQTSELSKASSAYAPPIIHKLDALSSPTEGGKKVWVVGSSFGPEASAMVSFNGVQSQLLAAHPEMEHLS